MGFIQTADFCAQSAHFFSGGFVVMVASLWLEPWLAALLFFLCWSGPKEIFFDWLPFGEDHGSPDWLDLTFYTLGNGVALLALYIKGV